MSIVHSLRRALGFSVTDEEAELEALAESYDDNLRAAGIATPFRNQPGQPAKAGWSDPSGDPAGGADWERERRALLADIDSLRRRLDEKKGLEDELRKVQLSAERRIRALSDRANDLEMQCDRLKADVSELSEQNARLRAAAPSPAGEATSGAGVELDALRAENRRLKADVDTYVTKSRMTDVMINDLTAQASRARKELAEAKARMAGGSDDTIEQLNAELRLKNSQLAQAEADLAEAIARLEKAKAGSKKGKPRKGKPGSRPAENQPKAPAANDSATQPKPNNNDDNRQMSLF